MYGDMQQTWQAKGDGSAAVNSAYGDRRTKGVTVVSSVADGRRTMNFTAQRPGH